MNTLGERLRQLRKEKTGKSQKEFGKIFGLSESAIGMYERNERKPDYETLEKLATYLETTVNYLITGKDGIEILQDKGPVSQLTDKDEKDIAKRLEEIRNDIEHADGLSFNGEPMSDEAKDSLMDAMEFIVRQAKKINKKYTPKKYRKEDNNGK